MPRAGGKELEAGGKPSTWFPPGRLVEHIINKIYIRVLQFIPKNFMLSADEANQKRGGARKIQHTGKPRKIKTNVQTLRILQFTAKISGFVLFRQN